MSSLSDYLAGPVTPERRAWWREATRQMDEMRALHAARDALPPAPLAEPKPATDYARATALFGASTAAALERVDNGRSLYDALYPDGDPEWDAFEAECAARAAEREANAEFYRAQEAKAQLAYQQRRIEEKVADESKMRLNREQLKSGMKLEKKACPCARLYSCVGDKSTIGPDGRRGAQPTTRHVSSECWSQERATPEFAYTWLQRHGLDPSKGAQFLPPGMLAKLHADAAAARALEAPHKCPWLHPGEAGWRAEWNANRLFKPAAAAPPPQHRMAAALAGGAPAPSAPRAPWAKASGGRSAESRNDGWETPKRR